MKVELGVYPGVYIHHTFREVQGARRWEISFISLSSETLLTLDTLINILTDQEPLLKALF